ncbi:putative ribosomal protein arginine N-methytransferase rmt3 [Microthyrium microscopicum]|uniref:type I protein arginine methyltransferase n=1 Tax=Microthyrium microscopicum TaxID=703497 RepID=A0A6A6UST8_9PEZI|nr:putative ribosomal protein arginine N-methytransferase rmt3 [Microthyrium microscopicum]
MSESTSSESDHQEDEWQDLEEDREDVQVVSLFDNKVFMDVPSMLDYCKKTYNFDFAAAQKILGLDFYGRIKLVNYIRYEVKNGNLQPDISSADNFSDDKYLQPALEDDALLFYADELEDEEIDAAIPSKGKENAQPIPALDPEARIKQLEEQLEKAQFQFAEYRKAAQNSLDKRWQDLDGADDGPADTSKQASQRDEDYFDSYSYNDIHETMLKDTIRTDAYRDFIYENKHLFKDKIVLDVGCGTGILSMFCARAGAAQVYAVDNSNIIEKAKENIATNGLSKQITCIRGKIEEIKLPVEKVDILVSEWMGYCLLYEAMLNSVLWARDKYLQPDGLMVPSHCVLHIAPLMDPDYVSENVEFWYDVYGFDMSAMMAKIYDDVLIKTVKKTSLAGKSSPFFTLPLHDITVADLTFRKDFSMEIENNIENLDGWVLWFDTFFLPSRTAALPATPRAEEWSDLTKPGVAFTTGPNGKETHWQSGLMLIDRKVHQPKALGQGSKISGSIGYMEAGSNKRGLEVEVTWHVEGSSEHGQQIWYVQ